MTILEKTFRILDIDFIEKFRYAFSENTSHHKLALHFIQNLNFSNNSMKKKYIILIIMLYVHTRNISLLLSCNPKFETITYHKTVYINFYSSCKTIFIKIKIK